MKIYIASSRKNNVQVNEIANSLRKLGHEVDAFCDTSTGRFVFSFSLLPEVGSHNAMTILGDEAVQRAFAEDKKWLDWSDCVLLLLPAGKSARLEAGYAKGVGKFLIIYQEAYPLGEFDVMYGFADLVTDNFQDVIHFLSHSEGVTRAGDHEARLNEQVKRIKELEGLLIVERTRYVLQHVDGHYAVEFEEKNEFRPAYAKKSTPIRHEAHKFMTFEEAEKRRSTLSLAPNWKVITIPGEID